MSRLSRNISANLVSNVWSTALALVLTPLYVKFLGVESYGLIGFYTSWIAILGILDTGISATATRQIAWLNARPLERDGIASLLRSLEAVYWLVVAVLGVAMLAAAWTLGPGWFHSTTLSPYGVRTALVLMAISLIVQTPSGLYVGGLMGLQRQVESAGLLALFGTLRGGGALIVVGLIRRDIAAFFMWQIAVSVCQTAAIRWVLWRRVTSGGRHARFSLATLRSVQRFTGGITLITALSVVLSQADKLILSRLVSLEVFGLYMLAWTVASGLSRIATPLIQAFGPHFTELVSRGDDAGLVREARRASLLMATLILPPAAMLILLARPILLAWTGNPAVSSGSAPLLEALVAGTVFAACSYPALSVLFSRHMLRPVIAINAAAVVVLLPLLVLAIAHFGALGAAFCWSLYGLTMYAGYQAASLRGLPNVRVASVVLRDFLAPAALSFAAAAFTWAWSGRVEGRIENVVLLAGGLAMGWIVTLLGAGELLKNVVAAAKWKTLASH